MNRKVVMLKNSPSSNAPTPTQAPTSTSQRNGSSDTVASIWAFRDLLAHDPVLPACHFGDLSLSRAELDSAASDTASFCHWASQRAMCSLCCCICESDHVDLSEVDLLAYCKAGIANYKVPKRIVFVDEFPEKSVPTA
jgi:hypothetical protein